MAGCSGCSARSCSSGAGGSPDVVASGGSTRRRVIPRHERLALGAGASNSSGLDGSPGSGSSPISPDSVSAAASTGSGARVFCLDRFRHRRLGLLRRGRRDADGVVIGLDYNRLGDGLGCGQRPSRPRMAPPALALARVGAQAEAPRPPRGGRAEARQGAPPGLRARKPIRRATRSRGRAPSRPRRRAMTNQQARRPQRPPRGTRRGREDERSRPCPAG